MALEKTRAVVLRRVYFQNSSLILTFLSPEHGRLDALAKGCRRAKSPLYGRLDHLMAGELVYYRKSGGALHIVSQFAPDAERVALRAPVERYAAAAFCGELAGALTVPEHPARAIAGLLEEACDHLEAGGRPAPTAAACGLQALGVAGFAPQLEYCVDCSGPAGPDAPVLDVNRGGVLCAGCPREGELRALSPPLLQGLRFLQRTRASEADRLSVPQGQERQMVEAVVALAQAQLGRGLRAGRFFLHRLEGPDRRRAA